MRDQTNNNKESKMLNPVNLSNGQEQYESYPHPYDKGITLYQYDYRKSNGILFSTVAHSLEKCRKRRDENIRFGNEIEAKHGGNLI